MKRILFLSASLIVLLMQQISAQGGFTIYDRFNSPLPENQCRFVRIDSQNRKWFCTEYGLAIFNDTTWSVYLTSNSGIPDNSVSMSPSTILAMHGSQHRMVVSEFLTEQIGPSTTLRIPELHRIIFGVLRLTVRIKNGSVLTMV